MKNIENLNLLNIDKLIIDDENKIFVVRSIDKNRSDQTCLLCMTELTDENFCNWEITLPSVCDKDYLFTSPNGNYQFKFYETNISKKRIHELLSNELKKLLNEMS